MSRTTRVNNNVRQLRKERGWTQEDLALRVGVHFTTIAKIERLERGISLDMLSALAAALEVDPAQILDGRSASAHPGMGSVPVISLAQADDWKAAILSAGNSIVVPDAHVRPDIFAVRLDDDGEDVADGSDAIAVVDPADLEVVVGRVYAVKEKSGGIVFKRLCDGPLRWVRALSGSTEKVELVGQETGSVIGRAIWKISKL